MRALELEADRRRREYEGLVDAIGLSVGARVGQVVGRMLGQLIRAMR